MIVLFLLVCVAFALGPTGLAAIGRVIMFIMGIGLLIGSLILLDVSGLIRFL